MKKSFNMNTFFMWFFSLQNGKYLFISIYLYSINWVIIFYELFLFYIDHSISDHFLYSFQKQFDARDIQTGTGKKNNE